MSSATSTYGNNMPANGGGNLSLWGYFVRSITSDYAAFSGRAHRTEFWSFQLFAMIFLFGFAIVAAVLTGATMPEEGSGEEPSLSAVLLVVMLSVMVLGIIVPSLAVLARRLHDLGMSGWWLLLTLIPSIGFIPFIIFGLIPSQQGANRFGASPHG